MLFFTSQSEQTGLFLSAALTENGDLKSSFCCHDTGTFSEPDILLVQSTDHNSTGLIEFNGQEPPLHMNRGKAVYPRDYPGCLGERRLPSLTSSVAKDDP